MKRKNEPKDRVSGSSTHYSNQNTNVFEPRPINTGFQSFLKWFRKNERERLEQNGFRSSCSNPDSLVAAQDRINQSSITQPPSNVVQIINATPPDSPALGDTRASSSSCDSVISTATNSFSFIAPNKYRPFGNLTQAEKLIAPGPLTDTYRHRLRADQTARDRDRHFDLTLRTKYNIFNSDTLTSCNSFAFRGSSTSPQYSDRSLPPSIQPGTSNAAVNCYSHKRTSLDRRKSHRRTVSDSSKDRKAGAYVHVKGKRKAPQPPPLSATDTNSSSSRNSTLRAVNTLSPASTFGRKKRRAPPPPTQNPLSEEVPTVLANGLFDDDEIQAIISGRSTNTLCNVKSTNAMFNNDATSLSVPSNGIEQPSQTEPPCPCTDTLRLERGVLKPNRDIAKISIGGNGKPEMDRNPPQLSPSSISPRPWYKRTPAANKDYAIPFKKEVILKTMEKRKNKHSNKELDSPQLPEVGFSRNSSLFEGFFSRINHVDKSETEPVAEKRKSGIMMPNISELDREAAEIVSKEHESERFKLKSEREKFFLKSTIDTAGKCDDTKDAQPKAIITKDFISSFDNVVQQKDTICESTSINLKSKLEQTNQQCKIVDNIFSNMSKSTSAKVTDVPKEAEAKSITPPAKQCENKSLNSKLLTEEILTKVEKTTDESLPSAPNRSDVIKEIWICPYCTLENAKWRVICEVCERFKPFDKKSFAGINESLATSTSNAAKEIIGQLRDPEKPTKEQRTDWETKAEKVMKYFRPKSTVNALAKSASETSVGGGCANGSGRSSLFLTKINSTDTTKISESTIEQLSETKLENESDQTQNHTSLNSSAVITTTVIPVFTGPEPQKHDMMNNEPLNLEALRQVRLARFSESSRPKATSNTELNQINGSTDQLQLNASNNETTTDDNNSKTVLFDDDPDALEKEKERLRELIRAMNAKALAEKYPILQQQKDGTISDGPESIVITETVTNAIAESNPALSSTELNSNLNDVNIANTGSGSGSSNNGINKTGAIKKVFSPKQHDVIDDKEIADSSNYSNTKSEKDRVLKVSSFAQTSAINKSNNTNKIVDYLELPSPIVEQNEESDSTARSSTTSTYQQRFTNMIKTNLFAQNERRQADGTLNAFDNYLDDSLGHIDKDLQRLEEISQQLNTRQGLDDFKATLKSSVRKISNTNTLALNKILKNLEIAIADGEHELAARLAMDLAKMKVSLSVTKQQRNSSPQPQPQPQPKRDIGVVVDIFIEDKQGKRGPIQLTLMPTMSVADLKRKINEDFQIPVHAQRWTLNGRLALSDFRILSDFGIKDKSMMHLYVTSRESGLLFRGKSFDSIMKPLNTKSSAHGSDLSSVKLKNTISIDSSQPSTSSSSSSSSSSASASSSPADQNVIKIGWTCPLCTLINSPPRTDCLACSEKRPTNYVIPFGYKTKSIDADATASQWQDDDQFNASQTVQLRSPNNMNNNNNIDKGNNDLNRVSVHRKSTDVFNIIVQPKTKINLPKLDMHNLNGPDSDELAASKPHFSDSANCFRPVVQKAIVMTARTTTTSPNITKNKYRGVDNYNPHVTKKPTTTTTNDKPTENQTNGDVMKNVSITKSNQSNENHLKSSTSISNLFFSKATGVSKVTPKIVQIPITMKDDSQSKSFDAAKTTKIDQPSSDHYTELLNLDHSNTIPNVEPFECPICFVHCKSADGVILKNCLHTFCRECLANTIKYSEDAEIKCPYIDNDYSCDSMLSEREIRALVTKDEYEQHLAVSLRVAENRTENAFHCKTPNCRGWCIYEDNVNQFKCPICQINNCLTCRVVHDGLNCKQYQDQMSNDCNNAEAQRTKEMLNEMIEKGEAINCPICQVVLMKKWGCDWLKCSMCKTEICWVTRGVRWGPEGKGDTSGGCKCGVNGIKCHPKCNYCH